MCGRFTLSRQEAESLAVELGGPVESLPVESLKEYRPRYNIAPTNQHWIVRMKYEDRELLPATWGLVNSWAKDKKRAASQINARAETIADRPAFRDAFQKRRCVVPADGFFEWTGPTGARQPFWYYRPDGDLLLFAGLYESWQPAPGQWERTFTIITTEANNIVRAVHDRMPVILPEERINDWLFGRQEDSEALRAMLVPAPDALLTVRRVSPRVNSAREDDPGVLEEVAVS